MPSHSVAQQQFMGMVYAYKLGKLKNPDDKIIKAANSISIEDAKKFASTKHSELSENMTFKQFVALDEGILNFAKGALGHVGNTVVDKINNFGQSGIGKHVTDAISAGKQASSVGNEKTSIKKQVSQLAAILKQFDEIKHNLISTPNNNPPNVVTPPTPIANKPTNPQQKSKMVASKYGDEYVFNSAISQIFGIPLDESPLDFVKGAAKAVSGNVTNAAKNIYAAGKQASKEASNQALTKKINQFQQHAFQIAAVLNATVTKLGDTGQELLKNALRTVPLSFAQRIQKLLIKRQRPAAE